MADLAARVGRQLQAGDLAHAEQLYRQMAALQPDDAAAHYNLGVVLGAQQRGAAAIACYRRALQLRGDFFEAHFNLGIVLSGQGELEEAAACYRRALELRPKFAAAWLKLGQSLAGLERWDEAVAGFRGGLQVQPRDPNLLNGLGAALGHLERWSEADACFHAALDLKPDFPEAHFNLGNSLRDQGKVAEALACYEAALKLRPDYAAARFNRCLLWLLCGEYERGWPEYVWRWRCPGAPARGFRQPLWDGADLGGRTILLHDDQGLGDFMQMIRFAPLVKRRGGVVAVECPSPLVSLLRGAAGIDRLIPVGEALPEFAAHAWLFALPGILGTTLATVPAEVPYLAPDQARSESWRRCAAAGGALCVGIVWQGNPTYRKDRHRSVPLAIFEPLARVPGVRLFSLQKGVTAGEIAGVGFPVTDLGSGLADFADTAGAIANLDLVIGTCTAVIHCAGAMGVPTWVALALDRVNDWRWLLGRGDSPWYPTVRLFRQRQPGAWQDVFERMAAELAKLAG